MMQSIREQYALAAHVNFTNLIFTLKIAFEKH